MLAEVLFGLERITHAEVNGVAVTVEPLAGPHPFVRSLPNGIMQFHAQIDPQEQEIQVQAKAQAPVCGDAVSQRISPESAVSQIISIEQPDVAGIQESRAIQLPEQREPVFHVGL